MSAYISIQNLTKDYGEGRGIFNISIDIEKGQTIGIVGINGAGKTTLLRCLMGFLKPTSGGAKINNLDCWNNSADIKKITSYIPGEINFPQLKYGTDFIKMQAEFLGVHDQGKANYAIDSLNLDIKANLKTMSKGMKQKTAIVDAFMGGADVMLLDEPTTGLDPLMHKTFDELIKKEKSNGKTIIMSSHIFTEVEECCDIVYLLKNGSIIKTIEMEKIHHSPIKKYNIRFGNQTNYIAFLKLPLNFENHNDKTFEISVIVKNEDINTFINTLTNYDIIFFNEIKYTLSEQFLKAYNNEDKK